jgi:DNA-binding HxlR family transcriptional regulator
LARTRFNEENCASARSLDILSDPWTLLIVQDACGLRRSAVFDGHLGISKNILSQRLQTLIDD